MMNSVLRALDGIKVAYRKELELGTVCTLRVGGIADLGIYPENEEMLRRTVLLLQEHHIPFFVVGKGSNLFFGDGRLQGALIFTEKMNRILAEGTTLFADCGVSLASLASYAAERSLTGLEFARGIPGTLGGAIFMNAGAYGSTMERVTVETRAMDRRTGEIFTVTDHDFGYRHSIYMEHPAWICLGAKLSLAEGNREEIHQMMTELAQKRKASQPLEFPSAGSYFKRPGGNFAGRLIEEAGLKGRRVGGAEISVKHAGFLINRGDATARDVLALEELVRNEVQSRFGVTLEREVRYISTAEQ